MVDSGSLFTANLISENVLKSASSRPESSGPSAISAGTSIMLPLSRFDPDAVRIDEVVGGFGTVIQIAAIHCMKVFDLSLNPTTVYLDNDAVAALLVAPHAPFSSSFLNQLSGKEPFGWR